MGCGFLDSGDSIQVFSKITIVVGFRGGGWWAGVPWEQYQYQCVVGVWWGRPGSHLFRMNRLEVQTLLTINHVYSLTKVQ